MELSPPHQSLVDDEVAGSIPDKLRSLFHSADLTPRFEIYPWSRVMEIAKNEPGVFISNIARTPERESKFHWITKLHRYELALIGLKENQNLFVDSIEDAKNYTIAIQRSDVAKDWLLNQGFSTTKNLYITSDITESWELLRKKRVDFVIDDPENILNMSANYLLFSQSAHKYLSLPELSIDTWLAANIRTNIATIKRLQSVSND